MLIAICSVAAGYATLAAVVAAFLRKARKENKDGYVTKNTNGKNKSL